MSTDAVVPTRAPGWAPMSGIDRTTRTVPGADGHEITL